MLKVTNETPEDAVSGLRPRERNKLDKLRRIKAAARELFLEQGYDNATTREIARRADVGLGTLFSYASDKRDLLFLIYNDMQEALTRTAFSGSRSSRTFLGQVMASFGVYQAEIRRWLTGAHPKPAAGLARLRAMLRIVIEGLKPGPGAA